MPQDNMEKARRDYEMYCQMNKVNEKDAEVRTKYIEHIKLLAGHYTPEEIALCEAASLEIVTGRKVPYTNMAATTDQAFEAAAQDVTHEVDADVEYNDAATLEAQVGIIASFGAFAMSAEVADQLVNNLEIIEINNEANNEVAKRAVSNIRGLLGLNEGLNSYNDEDTPDNDEEEVR